MWTFGLFALAALVVFVVYWPVHRAEFIWDDTMYFHNAAWLRSGDAWFNFVFHGIGGWVNYFRPLVIALFTVQLRLFDTQAEPMHLVSLALHIGNTCLVGLLARRLGDKTAASPAAIFVCMLVYGLHPVLVEPIVWISCQGELSLTFFMLLALIANASIHAASVRALAVALCFFVSACAKESAVALPILIVICDLFRQAVASEKRWSDVVRDTLRSQWRVYVALLIAGVAYLLLRAWAMGFVVAQSGALNVLTLARWQKVAYTYCNYLALAVWPMDRLAPLHEVDESYFAAFSWPLLFQCGVATAVLIAGAVLFVRRRVLGVIIISFSAALVAVLNIIPIKFVESAFHERYMMMALAIGAAWLASLLTPLFAGRIFYRVTTAAITVLWLAIAVFNVRVTIPLWSDENSLWQWASRLNPTSIIVRDHLLSVYLAKKDYAQARVLAQQLLDENAKCYTCLINMAFLGIAQGDLPLADLALGRLEKNPLLAYDGPMIHQYILASGELRELRNDPAGAEEAYRDAMTTDPYDPSPPFQLAALLMTQGKFDEGKSLGKLAVELYAPDERLQRQTFLDSVERRARQAAGPNANR